MITKIQLTSFCNNTVAIDISTISKLMNGLNNLDIKDFLPNITNGQNINLISGKVEQIQNLGFITMDSSAQVLFQPNRIDVIFNLQGELQSDLNQAKTVIKYILCECNCTSNRLAINIDLLSEPYVGDIKKSKFGSKIMFFLDYYKDQDLIEWSARENIHQNITVNGEKETLNVITELSLVTYNSDNTKRVLCHIDINTVAENNNYRFDSNAFDDFLNETTTIIQKIKDNFEELNVSGN